MSPVATAPPLELGGEEVLQGKKVPMRRRLGDANRRKGVARRRGRDGGWGKGRGLGDLAVAAQAVTVVNRPGQNCSSSKSEGYVYGNLYLDMCVCTCVRRVVCPGEGGGAGNGMKGQEDDAE